MYLSKLDIFGFKSFAQKTTMKFTEGIACVIGPNGSGKSNIVDAIRWVLGEQKISVLRTDRMENVIFNGTNTRKPLGVAEVSITIQNNKNVLKQEFSEVVISRRLYRSGESHYLINKAPCRLKDIQELFMDTGMGSDSYSVIELSMVENIISDNPADRRHLFEEAAGVTKYKARRKSALRKLDSTLQDMNRINDIITEIRRNVNSLSRQVGKARRYLEYKDELKKLEIDLARFRYTRLMDTITPLQKQLEEISEIKAGTSHQITIEEALLEEYKREILQIEDELNSLSHRLTDQDNQINQIKQDEAVAQTRSQALQETIKRSQQDIIDSTKQLEQLSSTRQQLKTDRHEQQAGVKKAKTIFGDARQNYDRFAGQLQQEKSDIHNIGTAYKTASDAYNSARELYHQKQYQLQVMRDQIGQLMQEQDLAQITDRDIEQKTKDCNTNSLHQKEALADIDTEIRTRQHQISDLDKQISSQQTELQNLKQTRENRRVKQEFFSQLLSRFEGHSQATRYLMQNRKGFSGVHGPLSEVLTVDDAHQPAVESALGETLNYVIVDTLESARTILQNFSAQKHGRVTLIPLDLLEKISPAAPSIGNMTSLANVISTPPPYKKIIDILLGDVYLVDNLEQAIAQSGKSHNARFVTPDGELFQLPHAISGGKTNERDSALLGRAERLEKLTKELENIDRQISKTDREIKTSNQQKQEILAEIGELDQRRAAIQETVHESEKYEARLNFEKQTLDTAVQERTRKIESLRLAIDEGESQLNELDKDLAAKQEQLDDLEDKNRTATSAYDQKYDDLQRQSEEMQKKQVELIEQQNKLSGYENELKRTEERIGQLAEMIEKRKSEIDEMQGELQRIRDGKTEREVRQKTIWESRDVIEAEREKIQQTYHELRDKILNLENEIKKYRKQHDSSVEHGRQLELQIQENQLKADNLKDRIQEEYGQDIGIGIAYDGLSVEDSEQQIETLKFKINQLGQVNPLAVSEYEKENERLQFYEKQYHDLEEAEKSLRKTIQKINVTARKQFLDTFEKIKVNFEKVFSNFFRSGEGTLKLDEESDPLEANIEIMVRPKGKRVQTIYLLSGGEKTLTAISLLFAIYLVKPSPFCILDEIDAPLDDVNIGRFTDALRDFSSGTQFIVVTHNKRTMEAADTLYGVTMEEEGLSKLVSVKFN